MIYPLTTQAFVKEELGLRTSLNHFGIFWPINMTDHIRVGNALQSDVHFVYSHSTTNTSQPHPSDGESLSPPLGGDPDTTTTSSGY